MSPLHIDILLALHAAKEFGLPLTTIMVDLRRGRQRTLTFPQAEAALRDLADKSFATAFKPDLGEARWRITARGTSALTEEGLA